MKFYEMNFKLMARAQFSRYQCGICKDCRLGLGLWSGLGLGLWSGLGLGLWSGLGSAANWCLLKCTSPKLILQLKEP